MGEEIIKVLDSLCHKFGVAIDWTSTNVLPYLQDLVSRIVKYRNGVAIIQIVLFTIAIIVGVVIVNKLRNYKNLKTDEIDDFCLAWALSVILIITGVGFIVGNSIGIMKNIYTPEIVAIEHIQEMQEWNS